MEYHVLVLPRDADVMLGIQGLSDEARSRAELAKTELPILPSIFVRGTKKAIHSNIKKLHEELMSALNTLKELLGLEHSDKLLFSLDRQLIENGSDLTDALYAKIYQTEALDITSVVEMTIWPLLENTMSGMAYTRHPVNGEKKLFGELVPQSRPFSVLLGEVATISPYSLDASKYKSLEQLRQELDDMLGDLHSFHFVFYGDKPLLTKLTKEEPAPEANVRIVVDLVNKKKLTKEEAILRVSPESLAKMLHPKLDVSASSGLKRFPVRGQGASPGVATGRAALTEEEAARYASSGTPFIFVAHTTVPKHISLMAQAEGILTIIGGRTSHAAVVARGLGKPCIVGLSGATLDTVFPQATILVHGEPTVYSGDWITIDGQTGEVYVGKATIAQPELNEETQTLLKWADRIRKLKVYANADDAQSVEAAMELGAQGIGLVRTEHMLLEPQRLLQLRIAILAEDYQREDALLKLERFQTQGFKAIFMAAKNKPVVIRLLDPPLHEFFNCSQEELSELSEAMNMAYDELKARIAQLHEVNPMLGHRGARLGITMPELYMAQVRAIVNAAKSVQAEGIKCKPHIMVPLIIDDHELTILRNLIAQAVAEALGESEKPTGLQIGAMIETPRAALQAPRLADSVEFLSFGTNDLTQMTLGISRDDASFMNDYLEHWIFDRDPFETIDEAGVGELLRHAIDGVRKGHKNMSMGVCGEHGGDAQSIAFFDKIGMDYVSCSPYRVPVARLAAAQARLRNI